MFRGSIARLLGLLLLSLTLTVSLQAQSGDSAIVHNHSDSATVTAADSTSSALLTEENHVADQAETQREPTLWEMLTRTKHLVMLLLMAVGIGVLFFVKVNRWIRLLGVVIIFFLFGSELILPVHPSPMCGVTKLFMFRFTWGQWFVGFLALTLVIFIPSLIYRKAFCGWVCPLGAFQEIVNKIPFKWRVKQFSFTAFNSVRMGLLAMFFITFFYVKESMDALGGELGHLELPIWKAYSAYNIYDPINYFEYLHWGVGTQWIIMMTILVIASLIIYRPFCYLICPIGAVSWLLEKIAPGKIRIDRTKCNECGVCVIKSPCPTIKPLIKADSFGLPDCTSCGECLSTCNRDAIKFSFKN